MGLDAKRPQLLQRVERARRVVSLCSQATIRAYDEEALLSEVCRILLDVGDYCMAWIGEAVTPDSPLRPLAHASAAASGVRSVQPPWATDLGPRSPTALAIHEQRPQVVRGIPDDAALKARYPEAVALAYSAVCAFPIQFGPHGAGSLTIYARESDAFAPEEVALLRELAGDIAVGIAGLRARQASLLLEDRLAAAERRYRSLIERAPIGVVQVGPDGQVVLVNSAAAALMGYDKPADVSALTPQQLAEHIDPTDVARIQQMVAAETPYPPLEMKIRRRDGDPVWLSVQAQASNGGREGSVEAFIRDLGPRRAAQLAHARLAAMVDSSEEAIIGIDADGKVQSWSLGASTLYGYDEAEAVGRPLAEVYIPEGQVAEWEGMLATLMQGQRVHRFETLRLGKRGEAREVSVAASPILDHDGIVVGASLTEHDVGERNRARRNQAAQEKQAAEVGHLQELNRVSTEFMGRASHELNTPLTPVLIQVQSLKDLPGMDPRAQSGLALIERNVLRLITLVKDLLAASELKSSRVKLKPRPLDLAAVAAEAAAAFQPQAAAQGTAIEVASPGPVSCFADEERVTQVLFNLLGNALKFTPRGGTIVVRADRRDGMACVTVADTGLGFPADAAERLFRPFSRLHEHQPGTPPGTGLGLFISHGLVEESGGTMWAESPGPGRGSTFGFTLPEKAPGPPTKKEPEKSAGRGIVGTTGFTADPQPPSPKPAAADGKAVTTIEAAARPGR